MKKTEGNGHPAEMSEIRPNFGNGAIPEVECHGYRPRSVQSRAGISCLPDAPLNDDIPCGHSGLDVPPALPRLISSFSPLPPSCQYGFVSFVETKTDMHMDYF